VDINISGEGMMTSQPFTGVSTHILHAKLPRLVGADVEIFPTPRGKFQILKERIAWVVHQCRAPFYHIKRTLPGPGGGIHAGILPEHIEDFGLDLIVAAGGAVHGHPMGGTAGAKALLQAIEAYIKKVNIEEYADEHTELKAAIEKWGVGKAHILGK